MTLALTPTLTTDSNHRPCTRHYFPAARTLLMLADPVQRAHQQQSIWLNNRCYRDAASAAAAREGRPVRLAKGA